jgi:hypothetical protein
VISKTVVRSALTVVALIRTARVASADAPNISTINPNRGAPQGGTITTITGTGFTGTTAVTFGGTPATVIQVLNDTTIRATTPPHDVGAFDVVVTNPESTNTLIEGFGFGAVPLSRMTNTRDVRPALHGSRRARYRTTTTGQRQGRWRSVGDVRTARWRWARWQSITRRLRASGLKLPVSRRQSHGNGNRVNVAISALLTTAQAPSGPLRVRAFRQPADAAVDQLAGRSCADRS